MIRDAIVETLIAANTSANDRVFPSRIVPNRKDLDLPVICVWITEDEVDPDSQERAPRELKRHASVTIECWVKPGENPDDAMDAFANEVEPAMHADPFFPDASGSFRASDSILENTTLEVIERGSRLMGLMTLFYKFTYYQLAPAAPVGADDFERVESTIDVNDADPAELPVDEFTVQVP